MVMDKSDISRRLSAGSLNGISVDDSAKKKHSFMNMFRVRKSEEAKFIEYIRNKKQFSKKVKSETDLERSIDASEEKDVVSLERRSCNTWSIRQASASDPSLLDEEEPTKSSIFRRFANYKSRHGGRSRQNASLSLPPNIPPFVELFSPLDDVSQPTINVRNSLASENDSVDCDETSSSGTDDRAISRSSSINSHCSIASTSYRSSAAREKSCSKNTLEVPSKFNKRRGTGEEGAKGFFSRLLGDRNKRDLGDLEEDVFDTWAGRNAMTLPRQTRRGKWCLRRCVSYVASGSWLDYLLCVRKGQFWKPCMVVAIGTRAFFTLLFMAFMLIYFYEDDRHDSINSATNIGFCEARFANVSGLLLTTLVIVRDIMKLLSRFVWLWGFSYLGACVQSAAKVPLRCDPNSAKGLGC